MYKKIDEDVFFSLVNEMRTIQNEFLTDYGVNDIWSNSKIFEIIIANELNHILIPGHSGSKDAKDKNNNEYEYKHYKETSSNHTWTFNDYSDSTLEELKKTKSVIFAHIEDGVYPPKFDWYYDVPGHVISKHLKEVTLKSTNNRKMWNVSKKQIEDLGYKRIDINKNNNGPYTKPLNTIFTLTKKIEDCCGTKGILTSNKFWEVMVAIELNHNVNSEQGGRAGAHDAYDDNGNTYEYKVSKNSSWNFQDISENVLNKYDSDKYIVLAIVDKTNMSLTSIFLAEPSNVVPILRKKLQEKKNRKGKLRRLQVSLSKGDLNRIKAIEHSIKFSA